MKPLSAREFAGNWASLLLPIDEDDSIDHVRLGQEIEALFSAGVDGIVCNDSAGEVHTLTEDDFDRVASAVASRCGAEGMPFVIGTGHASAEVTLQRLERVERFKPGAIQVLLPDALPLSQPEVLSCLTRFAEAARPINIVLEHPSHVRQPLDPELLARIKTGVPGLIGLQLVDGDSNWYAAVRRNTTGISLFVPGHHLATGLAKGAAGSVSAIAALSPAGAQSWYDDMVADPDSGLGLERRLRAFLREHVMPLQQEGRLCDPAVTKFLCTIGAWCSVGTRMRFPYRGFELRDAERLRPIARELLPELF